MFKYLYTSIIFLSIFSFSLFASAQTNCIDLKSDLKYGMNNSSVLSLQKYLVSINYLSATPNGYFGTATLAAVKKFQIDNSISGTGIVATLTRSVIQKKSCGTNATETNVVNDSIIPTTILSSFISPKANDSLRIGDSINIAWYGDTNYPHDIILEYPNGSGAGYIATSLSGENLYKWKIGNVYDAGADSNINVATGTYRIRIRKINAGISNNDPISNLFTLTAPPLLINSLSQSTMVANDQQVGVIFGDGFDSSSRIQFDYQYGSIAHNLYISSDGKVIVFSIPTFISLGLHTIMVSNSYGMVSNSLNLNIIK